LASVIFRHNSEGINDISGNVSKQKYIYNMVQNYKCMESKRTQLDLLTVKIAFVIFFFHSLL
jgi:hypothetical protein